MDILETAVWNNRFLGVRQFFVVTLQYELSNPEKKKVYIKNYVNIKTINACSYKEGLHLMEIVKIILHILNSYL